MRVALACPGVGLSQRGFERMFHDLFRLLAPDLDVTLFKGGGPVNAREKVPLFVSRNGRFVRHVPIHATLGRSPIHAECLSFALGLLPHLIRGDFDVVHCIDPPLVRVLYKLRRLLRLRFRLIYTHGCTMPPGDYPPADHLQHVAEGPYHECLAVGISASAMTLLPCGFHPQRFETPLGRQALRRKYGVSEQTFVVLAVSALNRDHKRVHHLIDEMARLDGDLLLWLDSSMDQGDPTLIEHARVALGDRCRLTHVGSEDVGELYAMADLLAHAAVFEAFGLAIVEAASSGLPVLVHDSPHFRWLVPNPACWIDMSAAGLLADRVARLMASPALLQTMRAREVVRQRFAWSVLRTGYRALYERGVSLPMAGGARAGINFFWQLHR